MIAPQKKGQSFSYEEAPGCEPSPAEGTSRVSEGNWNFNHKEQDALVRMHSQDM